MREGSSQYSVVSSQNKNVSTGYWQPATGYRVLL